jgi:hypothetical protein
MALNKVSSSSSDKCFYSYHDPMRVPQLKKNIKLNFNRSYLDFYSFCDDSYDQKYFMAYRKTLFLVPGVGSFSNANSFVLDQFIAEIKTDLNFIY